MPDYRKEYKIASYDTDFRGRIFIHSLLNYVQDIATEHAEALNVGRGNLSDINHFWVLSRLHARIARLPMWGEKITLRTWPRGIEALQFLRDVEVTDKTDTVLAGITTSWVVVDAQSRKPCRPETLPYLENISLTDEMALGRNAGRIAPLKQSFGHGVPFKVKPSDLDINAHVNNTKYVQWVYDSMSIVHHTNFQVSAIEANYIAESVEGDMIALRTNTQSINETGNNISPFSVIRTGDNRELCRIMIEWRPCFNQKVD